MKGFISHPLKSAIIFSLLAVLATAIFQFIPQNYDRSTEVVIKEAEKKLVELQKEVYANLERIRHFTNEKEFNDFFLQNGQSRSGFSFYVLDNADLKYWSDNEPSISDSMLNGIKDNEFLHLSNGDFLANTLTEDKIKIIGLILLKHSYDYQNKYLVNDFNPELGIGIDYLVSDTGDTLHLPGNKPVYIIKHDPAVNIPPPGIIIWVYFSIVILF